MVDKDRKAMKNFVRKYNLWYRTQQVVIFVLHLILLKWMYFVLSNSGAFSLVEVMYHFIGMSIMGAALIRGCAYWARHHYLKEIKQKHAKDRQDKISDELQVNP